MWLLFWLPSVILSELLLDPPKTLLPPQEISIRKNSLQSHPPLMSPKLPTSIQKTQSPNQPFYMTRNHKIKKSLSFPTAQREISKLILIKSPQRKPQNLPPMLNCSNKSLSTANSLTKYMRARAQWPRVWTHAHMVMGKNLSTLTSLRCDYY